MAETKQKVRVLAGRGGAPKTAQLPSTVVESQLPATAAIPATSTLAVLARAASDPSIDPAKMREILELQKEIIAEERRVEFHEAFVDLQARLPVIDKDGKIEIRKKDATGERTGPVQQASPYSTFENIMDVVQPLLSEYRFGLSFETAGSADGKLIIRGVLSRRGHERRTEFPLPAETSGSKNNLQGWGSTMSYGKRYATIALLNIRSRAIQDRDTDGRPGKFKTAATKQGDEVLIEQRDIALITDAQFAELHETIEWCGVPLATVLAHYGIASLSKLPAKLFETAIKDCKDYHANQERKRQAREDQDRQGYRR